MGREQYQTDSDSGLLLLGHRYYDPYTGRFISQDPIADGDNWYAYAENNPLTGVDPEGLLRARGGFGGSSDLTALQVKIEEEEAEKRRKFDEGLAELRRRNQEVIFNIGPVGKARGAASLIKGGTYILRDAIGRIMRTGRSKDLGARKRDHANDPQTKRLEFEVDKRTDSYPAQRGREQIIHEKYKPPLNKINPISPKNPSRERYINEGRKLGK